MPETIVHKSHLRVALAVLLIGAGLVAVAYGAGLFKGSEDLPPNTPLPTKVVERLIPTLPPPGTIVVSPWVPATLEATAPVALASPAPVASVSPTDEGSPAATVSATATPEVLASRAPTMVPSITKAATQEPAGNIYSPRQRMGFVAPLRDAERYDVARLGAGWHISCQRGEDPVLSAGMECAQLLGYTGGVDENNLALVRQIAASHPGMLWLLGNEPDVIWQMNATPEEYARLYHNVYEAIKGADPTSQVAIGAVSQVTPLRLRYLEEIMAAYAEAYGRSMPVDVWNIHLAILREERGTWGVDIPPGMPDDAGILYEIEDNGDVEILKKQVRMFRRWMAEQGLRDRPLIVTEFSVLMPEEYGFPFERVRAFMIAAFDFLMTATDPELGYPADGNRLVQRWAWYSAADHLYSTGNLFDYDTGQLTALGEAFAAYAAKWQ